MVQVTIGTNVTRKTVVVEDTKTVKEVLQENDVNYTTSATHLDGAPLSAEEMNSTFAELGVTDSCYLLNIVKADNA